MILWTEDRLSTKGKNKGLPVSTARVRVQCDECKVAEWETAYCFRKVRDYDYCQSCKNKLHITGMGGKKHSDEFKRIRSEKWKGDGNIAKREDVRRKISEKSKRPQPKLLGRKRHEHSVFMKKRMLDVWSVESDERKNLVLGRVRVLKRLSSKHHSYLHDDVKSVLQCEFPTAVFISEHPVGKLIIDEFCQQHQLAIEINGDYWHANPTQYSHEQQLKMYGKFRIVSDIWERDQRKIQTLNANGIRVYTIWESDWRSNRPKILDELRKIIQ